MPALGRRGWAALLVLCGALFLDGLDVSMVGMALPSIHNELHLSTTSLQWVVSGYVLGYGGFLLLGGRAADLLGRKRVFVIAIAVFLLASLLGGLATDGTVLIATRFIKGIAAAFTAPAGLSIITTTFAEGPARNKALGIYAATGASGFSLGLVLGGLLTTLGWRWCFFLPVPIAAAILAIAPRVIPSDPPRAAGRRHYDLAGAFSVTATMLLLVYTVTQAPQHGWTSARTALLAALTVLVGALFVGIELRVREPLVRLGILRSWTLVGANLGAMTMAGAYFSFQFVLSLYLQQTRAGRPSTRRLPSCPRVSSSPQWRRGSARSRPGSGSAAQPSSEWRCSCRPTCSRCASPTTSTTRRCSCRRSSCSASASGSHSRR